MLANLNDSLLQYQVYDDDDINDDDQSYNASFKKSQALFYLIVLVLGQIFWITLGLVSFNKGNICFVGIAVIVLALGWTIFGYKCKYMKVGQFLFWIQAIFHTLMVILAMLTEKHQFILCGCSTGIIAFIVVDIFALHKVINSKIFFYIYMWYSVIFYDDLKKLYSHPIRWYMMIVLYIYFVFFAIVYVLVLKRWRNFTNFAKWQVVILSYPLSLILVLSFAGSFNENSFHFNWVWLTMINHAVFFYCCYFIIMNRKILPVIKRRKQIAEQFEDNRMRLYQVSNNFLSSCDDFVTNPRQSMKGGVPVAECSICLDKISSFCYLDCLHLSVCQECALELLKGARKNCPFCRCPSNMLLKVQRLDGVIFVVISRYRFQNN